MFRAFLQRTKEETDNMTMQEYLDDLVMFREVMKFYHAPYMKGE